MRTLPLALLFVASTAAAQDKKSLEARLLPLSRGQLVFDLNDKAYVAIYLVPTNGGGPALVYHSEKKPEVRGEHTVRAELGPVVTNWEDYQHDIWLGRHSGTLVVIASRTPLNTAARLMSAENDDDRVAQLVTRVTPPGATVAVGTLDYRF